MGCDEVSRLALKFLV